MSERCKLVDSRALKGVWGIVVTSNNNNKYWAGPTLLVHVGV